MSTGCRWATRRGVRRGLPVLGGLQPHYSARQVDAFVDALQLFGIGYSWAGP
jgi:hypothetical protein